MRLSQKADYLENLSTKNAKKRFQLVTRNPRSLGNYQRVIFSPPRLFEDRNRANCSASKLTSAEQALIWNRGMRFELATFPR